MRLEIEQLGGNDLAVDFQCTCPHKTIDGLNHRINLYWYYDNYFFDTVNSKFREFLCKCGKNIINNGLEKDLLR